MDIRQNELYLDSCRTEDLAGEFETPLYVYEAAVIRRQCQQFRAAFAKLDPEIYYALKANPNPALLAILQAEGMGIDAVSPWEVRFCLEQGFTPERIVFTGNNTTDTEMQYCLDQGIAVNVGSLCELERYGALNPGGSVAVRINPDVGDGHHHHVITGGPDSKFGIHHTDLGKLREILTQYRLTLCGIQSHIGTGILKTEQMLLAMEIILAAAKQIPNLEFIDFGGGFGIPYQPDSQALPLAQLGREMERRFRAFVIEYGREVRMRLEPGRYLVAQSGTLLVRVTNVQSTPTHTFVGTDSGFNHLLRPAMYGAYHHIVNATMVEGPGAKVVVAGNICESGDVFTQNAQGIEDRVITHPKPGHLLAICDVGAYGFNLASQYNFRPRPAEVLVEAGQARIVRHRETYNDLLCNYVL